MQEVVQVDNIKKSFKNKLILKGISFQIKKGDIHVFLGPNGAGKTTTIKLMTNLLLPDEGSIRIFGDIVTKKFEKIKNHLGVMSAEKSYLINSFSLYTNLKLFGGLYNLSKDELKNRIEELGSFFELEKYFQTPVSFLSQGLKNKANLCRCLLHKPDLLILDEPTASMDVISTNKLHQYIKAMSKNGVAIFMATHNMAEAKLLGTHVSFIDQGVILENDTLSAIMKKYKLDQIKISFNCREFKKLNRILDSTSVIFSNDQNQFEVIIQRNLMQTILRKIINNVSIDDLNIQEASLEKLFYISQKGKLRKKNEN